MNRPIYDIMKDQILSYAELKQAELVCEAISRISSVLYNLDMQTLPEIGHESATISLETFFQMGEMPGCELIEGVIYQSMPTGHPHAKLELFLGALLLLFVTKRNLGHTFAGEVGIIIRRNPDTLRAADIAFMSHERYEQLKSASYLDVAPELIVEILSPDDRWSGVNNKLADYFSANVQEVWLVDPQRDVIHIAKPNRPLIEIDRSDRLQSEILPGFDVSVADIFDQNLPD